MRASKETLTLWADERLEEELLKRFSGSGRVVGWRLLRFHVKRLAWGSVIAGALGLKRLLDMVVAGTLLVVLAPVYLLIALLIRLESPGSVLFRQTRVGMWGLLFSMWKFRSMYVDAEERKKELERQNEMVGGVTFKMKSDPRITRVGKYIRKGSLDELPQLWNVFKGEMSLVGPRPPVPKEVALYTLADRRRLEVKPGITCIWQVSGRSEIPFDQQVELDVAYIQSQSLWLDIVLLAKTIPAVVLGKGAY